MPIYHIKTSAGPDGTDTDMVSPSDWNSAHAYTMQDAVSLIGNTAGVLSNISSGTLYLAGGNNITLSQNGNSVTISELQRFERSYENLPGDPMTTMSFNGASASHALAFKLPYAISASFIRLPAVMITQTSATSIASQSSSWTGSHCVYSTWNAVVYSVGTGASSNSLISVASGSNGWTYMNSISVANNGTEHSYTIAYSANATGGQVTTSTQYSMTSSSYVFSNGMFSNFNGNRFIDIDFNNSLDAGVYWLAVGYSSSSASNNTVLSNHCTNVAIRYNQHMGVSAVNSTFGILGVVNNVIPGRGSQMGCGSFSTVGGGTTSAFPLSAIVASTSNIRPYFQMLR